MVAIIKINEDEPTQVHLTRSGMLFEKKHRIVLACDIQQQCIALQIADHRQGRNTDVTDELLIGAYIGQSSNLVEGLEAAGFEVTVEER